MSHLHRHLRGASRGGGPTAGDDRGAAALALIVGVVLSALALVAFVVVPLTQSTGLAGRSTSAADAAALAGAQRAREVALDAVLAVTAGGSVADAMPPSVGISAAQTYAQRNGAELVGARYEADLRADRVRVEVRVPDPDGETSGTHRAAEAELGVALDRCRLTRTLVPPPPPPPPTPTPTPDPSASPTPTPSPTPPPPPPPPVWDYAFTCADGGGSQLVRFGPTRDLADVRQDMRRWLDSRLEPRLVR